ncbi:MAG TPA: hypothetical protein VI356_22870 [Myxococcales bacterium]
MAPEGSSHLLSTAPAVIAGNTATFHGVTIDRAGIGLALVARAGSLTGTSRPFDALSRDWDPIGPSGGAARAMTAVPGSVLVATVRGLFRSDDGATSWSRCGLAGLREPMLRGVAALTAGEIVVQTESTGLFRSTDGCATWTSANDGLRSPTTLDVKLSVACGTIQASSVDGLFVWNGMTARWDPAPLPPGETWLLEEACGASGNVYAFGSSGSVRYLSGDSWASAPRVSFAIMNLAVSPRDDRILLAIDGNEPKRLMRSTDRGKTWAAIASEVDRVAFRKDGVAFASTEWIGEGVSILESTDDGSTWVDSSGSLPATSIQLAFDADDAARVYAGLSTGILGHGVVRRDSDAARWEPASAGLRTACASRVSAQPQSGIVFATVEGALYASRDEGNSWATFGPAGATAIAWAPSDEATLAVTTAGTFGIAPRLLLSHDGGVTWSETLRNVGSAVAFDPADSRVVFATLEDGEFVRSLDGGATWSAPACPFCENGLGAPDTRSFTFVPGTREVYASAVIGYKASGGIWRSGDGGESWARLPAPSPAFATLLDPLGSGRLISGYTQINVSDDAGRTWFATFDPDPSAPPRAIRTSSALATLGGAVLAATSSFSMQSETWTFEVYDRGGRVVQSLDGGLSWAPFGAALGEEDPVAIATQGGVVYVGTLDGGILKSRGRHP